MLQITTNQIQLNDKTGSPHITRNLEYCAGWGRQVAPGQTGWARAHMGEKYSTAKSGGRICERAQRS